MPYREYGTNDAETNKVWAEKVQREFVARSFWANLVQGGEGSSANKMLRGAITRKDELEKEQGDRIRVTTRGRMIEKGVTGNQTVVGKAEKSHTGTYDVIIDVIRHGFEHRGLMSGKRPKAVTGERGDAKSDLTDWLQRKFDQMMTMVASGMRGVSTRQDLWNTGITSILGNSFVAPDSAHLLFAGPSLTGSSASALTSADVMTVALLRNVNTYRNETLDSPIPGLMDKGYDAPVLLISHAQYAQLKEDPEWKSAADNAAEKGHNNPFFSGNLYNIDGLLIKPYGYLCRPTSTTHRALLLGAGHMCLAYGSPPNPGYGLPISWYEDDTGDAGTISTTYIGAMMGATVATFPTSDSDSTALWRNALAIDTYSATVS